MRNYPVVRPVTQTYLDRHTTAAKASLRAPSLSAGRVDRTHGPPRLCESRSRFCRMLLAFFEAMYFYNAKKFRQISLAELPTAKETSGANLRRIIISPHLSPRKTSCKYSI